MSKKPENLIKIKKINFDLTTRNTSLSNKLEIAIAEVGVLFKFPFYCLAEKYFLNFKFSYVMLTTGIIFGQVQFC